MVLLALYGGLLLLNPLNAICARFVEMIGTVRGNTCFWGKMFDFARKLNRRLEAGKGAQKRRKLPDADPSPDHQRQRDDNIKGIKEIFNANRQYIFLDKCIDRCGLLL